MSSENTTHQTVARIRLFNRWRRGEMIDQPNPMQLGEDLDELCDAAERMAETLKDIAKHGGPGYGAHICAGKAQATPLSMIGRKTMEPANE